MSPSSHDEAHEMPMSKDILPTAHALTPPTSEDMNTKLEDSSSDLSDLDLDEEDDDEEIQPDHYYEGGKVPVFKPVRAHSGPILPSNVFATTVVLSHTFGVCGS